MIADTPSQMLSKLDLHWMSLALKLAEKGRYTARPNPCVGCVVVKDNTLLAEGWHYRAGEPHAEVHALSCLNEGQTQGATAYVTLEPCNHQGRTGPCTEALIKAGIVRVVYGMQDPNPQVSGQGLERLRAARITVDGPVLEPEARALNPGFVSSMVRKRPYVRCKMAMSLDGRTAMASGESQWISGPNARADTQRLRARSCAIITGIDSVLMDNSRLNLRADELLIDNASTDHLADIIRHPPIRVVLDSKLRLPADAAILQGDALTVIFTAASHVSQASLDRLQAVSGVKVVTINTGDDGRLLLTEVLDQLSTGFDCREVLLEAGPTLAGEFFKQQLIDEWVIYQAPVLMGSSARPLLSWPIETMMDKQTLDIIDRRLIGDDLRITARPIYSTK